MRPPPLPAAVDLGSNFTGVTQLTQGIMCREELVQQATSESVLLHVPCGAEFDSVLVRKHVQVSAAYDVVKRVAA